MRLLEQFWLALGSLPGLAAVSLEWQRQLGDEWEIVNRFLQPRGDRAVSYPCPATPQCGCEHHVVEHSRNDIVVVCTCDPSACETISVDRADLVVFELDPQKLAESISQALSLTPGFLSLDPLYQTYLIGWFSPFAGARYNAYLTIQHEADAFLGLVESLLARDSEPFILFCPQIDYNRFSLRALLGERRILVLILHDILFVDRDGQFAAVKPASELLAPLYPVAQDSIAAPSGIFTFPTPPDATWRDVDICLLDGNTVRVSVLGISHVLSHAQLGLARKNDGMPTAEWEFLERLAEGNRFCASPRDYKARRAYQKQRERLADQLKKFLRIPGEPIQSAGRKKGWEAAFSVRFSTR